MGQSVATESVEDNSGEEIKFAEEDADSEEVEVEEEEQKYAYGDTDTDDADVVSATTDSGDDEKETEEDDNAPDEVERECAEQLERDTMKGIVFDENLFEYEDVSDDENKAEDALALMGNLLADIDKAMEAMAAINQ